MLLWRRRVGEESRRPRTYVAFRGLKVSNCTEIGRNPIKRMKLDDDRPDT